MKIFVAGKVIEIIMNDYSYMAQTGFVTSSGGDVTVNAASNQKVSLYFPPGFSSLPSGGEKAVVFPSGGGMICGGVKADTSDLLPGEVRVYSAGGAAIVLKANGDIDLNGIKITRDGKVLRKENGRWIQK